MLLFLFQLPPTDADLAILAKGNSIRARRFRKELQLVELCINHNRLPVSTYLHKVVEIVAMIRDNNRRCLYLHFLICLSFIHSNTQTLKLNILPLNYLKKLKNYLKRFKMKKV